MIYAVDFDGTLVEDAYPHIGKKKPIIFNLMISKAKQGDKIILNTMREGSKLREAVEFCEEHGLFFDAINDNLEELKIEFDNNPRKIFADYYIDDRAINVNDIENMVKTFHL